MEPGVPFALLGAVQLLAVVAVAGLAAGALARRGPRPPALLLVAGAAVVAAAEVRTALALGRSSDDLLVVLRAGGLLLVGAGLALGALGRGLPRPPAPAVALPAVVVPLGASPAPSVVAGAAGLLAAAGALRGRRDAVGVLLALGLLLSGAAGAAAQRATTDGGALLVLGLRGAGALALLLALVVLARSSLLSQVIAAILAGVVVMAAAAVGVVGTVVVSSYDEQAQELVQSAADQRRRDLLDFAASRSFVTLALRQACAPGQPEGACAGLLGLLPAEADFVVRVPQAGEPVQLAARSPLSATELLGLRDAAAVGAALGAALGPQVTATAATSSPARLTGALPAVAALSVLPENAREPDGRPSAVLVYGARVDGDYLARDLDEGSYTQSLLVDGAVAATNGGPAETAGLLGVLSGVGGVGPDGVTVVAQGSAPTVRLLPLTDLADQPVAVLAVARDARAALAAQRDALQALFLTALAAAAAVGGLAVVLGRRTVEPVRRLTAAAERVAAGDLATRTDVRTRDEVGTLSRAFDAMTGSLAGLTGDLRDSAARLQTVLSSMSDGLLATDAEGRVTSANPAALALVGLADEAEALGRPLGEVVDVRDATGTPLADPELRLRDVDAQVHRADGTRVPVRVELRPLEGAGGVVLVLRDTTREREVERMKTEFLANVSHELRTPLTPIRGYADLLATRELAPAQVTSFAGTILAESLKMNRVVDLLVDVAALEAGRVHVALRQVAVGELLDARLAAWRARVPERAPDLRRRLVRGLPPVRVDPSWVAKALDELVDNALKHTPPGTPVTLGASPCGDRVRVAVTDRGPGIAEGDRQALFTSFEQVDGSATRRVGGLGLGLSFVRRVADDQDLRLQVTSAPGEGATFSLDLPTA